MKTYMILLMVSALLLQGCDKEDLCNCLENTGGTATETRLLQPFNAIELNNNIDIVLYPDTAHFVKITCGKNLADGIKTEINGNKLVIRNINKCNWLRDFENRFTAEIHFTQLSQVTNNGSGDLTCADTLREGSFQVDSWNGTGKLSFLINGSEVRFKLHTGPADIYASGKAGILYIYSAGNGFFKTAGLESEYTYVTTKSTGDCEVFVKKELGVSIEYNGDVYYKGNPEQINQQITGNGSLIAF